MAKQTKFEMPKCVVVDKKTATPNYAKMVAEPFEAGFGHTIGNSLRRVLLSSLEGAAITAVKIEGAKHEFDTIDGVYEDVTHIILNLKKVLFSVTSRKPFKCVLKAKSQGNVTAVMIKFPAGVDVLNPDLVICSLDKKASIYMEFSVTVGRGYRPAELNKDKKSPIGIIAIDSLFSPVSKVRYVVEAARVGMKTDYDRLVLEVWTDGRIDPVAATVQSAELLLDHVQLYSDIGDPVYLEDWHEDEEVKEEEVDSTADDFDSENESIENIELSKRIINSLAAVGVDTVGKLAKKTESELLSIKNFGAKAVNEILSALKEKNLTLKAEPATDKQIVEMMKKSAKTKKI